MKQSRIIYAETILIFLICWIISDKTYLLGLFIAGIVILLCDYLLLRLDTTGLKVSCSIRNSCENLKKNELQIKMQRRRMLTVAGTLELTVEFYNSLLDRKIVQSIKVPVYRKQDTIKLTYEPTCCGEVHITMKETTCSDLLDLFKVPISNTKNLIVTVHPAMIPINVLNKQEYQGNIDGGEYYQNKIGKDISEIFDMKEYVPGDDIRSIHWKLSSKTDNLLTRIGSNVTHYHTMVLLDLGLEDSGKSCDHDELSCAIEVALEMNKKMIEVGIPHYTAMPVNGNLYGREIEELDDAEQWSDTVMGLTLEKEIGMGLKLFELEQMSLDFVKLVYITTDKLPDKLTEIADSIVTTAICVSKDGNEVKTANQGQGQIIEMPINKVREKVNTLFI